MKSKIRMFLFVLGSIVFSLLLLLFWAFFIEPNLLIVKNVEIEDSLLAGIRIVYISDIHACKDDGRRLLRIVKKINEQDPDVILLGGDYVVIQIFNNESMRPELIGEYLSGLRAKYGTFMVLGNHDANGNISKGFKEKLKESTIKVLDNSNVKLRIGDRDLWFVGLGDFSCGRCRRQDIEKAFDGVEKPAIAFTHSPDVISMVPDFVSLVLAGHTHGGQVALPFYGPLGRAGTISGKHIKGFYDVDGKRLFVSSGVGTSHLKVRFFNIPEIVVVDFK